MRLFTAGYEGQTLASFLTSLEAQGVKMLADVREAPISRKPGFSKNRLAEALHDKGIGYRHLRALGCPKAIRDAHRADGDWQKYTVAYLAHLAQQQPAVAELAALATEHPTALLCFEADFQRCHRTYVARAVAQLTASTVCHITREGLLADV